MSFAAIKIEINGVELDGTVEFNYTPAANGDESDYDVKHLMLSIETANINADVLLLCLEIEMTIIEQLETLRPTR
jgi:hypothetical protein